jgi:hypothetical protein
MQVKLRMGEVEKTFSTSFISTRMLRRTLEIKEQLHSLDKMGLDKVVEYMVDLFGNQFTIDEVYDGVPVKEFLSLSLGCMDEVITQFTGAVEKSNKKENMGK